MALHFTVSAPGKVILSGEHSVVYGKPALAGVIGLVNALTLKADNESQSLVFNMDLTGDSWIVAVDTFNVFLSQMHETYKDSPVVPQKLDHDRFLSYIMTFVDEKLPPIEGRFKKSRYAAVYLLTGTLLSANCEQLSAGFQVDFKSGLNMGAGLGSSASFGVCLATAFHFYAKHRNVHNCISHYNTTATKQERTDTKDVISNWAFCSEKLMHGNPSGLDNAICTLGSIVKFYKGATPIGISLNVPLNVILVNTGVERSTMTLVKNVAALKSDHNALVDSILDAMGTIVDDVIEILNAATPTDPSYFEKFARLIRINNNLLRSLGVSHPSLEKVFAISERYGFASKLTGAGGGGYAIVMLPPAYKEDQAYVKMGEELTANGFEWHETTIGGDGVAIREL